MAAASPASADDIFFAWAFPTALSLPQHRARAYEDSLADVDGLIGAASDGVVRKRARTDASTAHPSPSDTGPTHNAHSPSSEEQSAALARARASLLTAYGELNVLLNLIKITRSSGRASGLNPTPSSSLFDRTAIAGIPPPQHWFETAARTARGLRILTLKDAGRALTAAADRFTTLAPTRRAAQRDMEALIAAGWRILSATAARATLTGVHDRDLLRSTLTHVHGKALSVAIAGATVNALSDAPHVVCVPHTTLTHYANVMWREYGAALLAPVADTGRAVSVKAPPYTARGEVIQAAQARYEATGVIAVDVGVRGGLRRRVEVQMEGEAAQRMDCVCAFHEAQEGRAPAQDAPLAAHLASACVAACVRPEVRTGVHRGAAEETVEAVFFSLLTDIIWGEVVGLAAVSDRLESSYKYESTWPAAHAVSVTLLTYATQRASVVKAWSRAEVVYTSLKYGEDGVTVTVACREVDAAAPPQRDGVLESKEDEHLLQLPPADALSVMQVRLKAV